MATKKSLPQDSSAPGKKKPRKRKDITGVVEKKIYDISKAESDRTGKPRKLLKTYRYVRVRFKGADGKLRPVQAPFAAGKPKHAKEVRAALKNTLRTHGEKSAVHWNANFNDLADYYEKKYLVPAEYVDGKKLRGRRKVAVPKSQLQSLRNILGKTRCRNITYEVCRDVRIDCSLQV